MYDYKKYIGDAFVKSPITTVESSPCTFDIGMRGNHVSLTGNSSRLYKEVIKIADRAIEDAALSTEENLLAELRGYFPGLRKVKTSSVTYKWVTD